MGCGERTGVRAMALALLAGVGAQTAAAAPTAADPKPGSAYLQCDGKPNNMTAGESAARLLGAVTLLGLFAPQPETADASKRKFGADGVAVCSSLIEGDHAEGNPDRRVGLILGRALHRIEATDYSGAIADAELARREATAAGLMASPYYLRSRGTAFDAVESAALLRQGRAADARAASLRSTAGLGYAVLPTLGMATFAAWNRNASADELAFMERRSRMAPPAAGAEAERLEELGRFGDAARIRDGLIDYQRAASPDLIASGLFARAALSHALAGDREGAARLAEEARANADKRRADGKPDANESELVELADLYGIVDTATRGDAKAARRLFAARSQWVSPSFGVVLEVDRRLREGATPDELIGGLKNTPDQLWQERADRARAAMVAKDADNATLFHMIAAATPASAYQSLSKTVWRTDKSKMLLKPSAKAPSTSRFETLYLFGANPFAVFDAYALHAALLAKSRGQQGFVILPVLNGVYAARILTGNRGEPGLPPALFNDADAVIAALSPIIPSPDTPPTGGASRPS